MFEALGSIPGTTPKKTEWLALTPASCRKPSAVLASCRSAFGVRGRGPIVDDQGMAMSVLWLPGV